MCILSFRMEAIKKTQGIVNRQGGFLITDRALTFCSFPAGAKIIDLGCGSGASVDYMIHNFGLEAYGLDKNPELPDARLNMIKASAEEIPFPEASMDGVLIECSFSLMDDQVTVLKECYRVLKAEGRLIISDIYARGKPVKLKGSLGLIDTKEDFVSKVESNGFTLELFEDFSHHFQTMWGQMIFEKGAQALYNSLGTDPGDIKPTKCGYCLIIAGKNNSL